MAAIICVITTMIVAVVAHSQTAPSVPNLIAYQGRVTLAGGSPVADGSYPAIFALYNNSSGGASLWTESASITTSGGTFTHNLGSVTTLPTTLSVANDSLWLATTFNGELLTPRARIVGNAFSLTSNDLEMNNGSGTVALRTMAAGHQLSQYGADGAEQVRLWGAGWGELYLDASAVNASNDDVRLTSNNGNGGRLDLRKSGGNNGVTLHGGSAGAGATLALTNDAGLTTVFMDGDQSGDVAVQLPGSSIGAAELLSEPGVAANNSPDSIIPSGLTDMVSRIITVPASGYVIALASLSVQVFHSFGTTNLAEFWIEDTTTVVKSLETGFYVDDALPTGNYTDCITVQSVFPVTAGARGFVFSTNATAAYTVAAAHLTLLYVPTAYGTVVAPSAPNAAEQAQLVQPQGGGLDDGFDFDKQRIEREVTELRMQAEVTTRRLAELESQLAKPQVEP